MDRRVYVNHSAAGGCARRILGNGARGASLLAVAVLTLAAAEPPASPDPEAGQAPSPGPAKPAGPAAKKPKEYGIVGVGIIGGGQLRDWFSTAQNPSGTLEDRSGRFMIGGTFQFHLSPRYTVEVDAMRRGFGVKSQASLLGVGFSSDSNGSSWEFPFLLKRHFVMHNYVRPFLGAGISIRHVNQNSTVTSTSSSSTSQDSQGSNSFGIPLSAGLDFRARMFRISPELRYTLWTADKSFAPVRVTGLFDSLPNQVAFIVGFTIN